MNSIFARYYNKQVKRCGQLVMDRFKSPVIESQADLLKVMYYIDLNPKRAKMVKHPKEFQWSSFSHYAYGTEDALISEPQCYLDLGDTPAERQKRYVEMVDEILMNDWKEKKDYSSESFIGNPEWVTMRYLELKRQLKLRRKYLIDGVDDLESVSLIQT